MTNIYIAGGAGILVIVLVVIGIIKLISGKPKGNFKPTYNSSFNQQSTVNQEFDNQQNEFVDNEINNDLVVNDNLQSNPSFIIQNDNSVNEEDVNPEPAFVQPGFIATPNTQVTDAQVVSEPTDNNLVEESVPPVVEEVQPMPMPNINEVEQTPVNQELDQQENIKIEEQQMPSIEMPALNSEVTTNESNVNSFVPTQTVLEQQPLPNIEIPALNSNATPVDNQQPEPITFQQPTSTIDIPSAVDENIEPTVELNLNDSKEFQNKLEEPQSVPSFDIPMSVEVPQINNNSVETSALSNVEIPSIVDEEIEPTVEFNLADEPEIKQILEQQNLPDIDIPVSNEVTQPVENNIQQQNTSLSDEIPIPIENIINNNQ